MTFFHIIIPLLSVIPIYLIANKIVSKQTTKAVRIKSILLTLVSSIVLFIGLVKVIIPLWKAKSFSSVEWKTNKNNRYRMVNDLLKSKQLNNLSKKTGNRITWHRVHRVLSKCLLLLGSRPYSSAMDR